MISSAWMTYRAISNSIAFLSAELGRGALRGRGQREGHDVVTARRAERSMAARADDQILTLVAPGAVGHRSRLTAGGKLVPPQLAPGLDIEGTQVAVHRTADEHQVAGGRNRPSHHGHTKVARRQEPRREPFSRAERYLPGDAITTQVDA